MKDRLITLLGAIIAFYILFRLLFPQVDFAHKNISFPTSEDHGEYGLAGLYHWLDTQHIPLYSLRERYDTLQKKSNVAKQGNLLIISLPLRMDARVKELKQLQTWIKNGNSALLLASMSDWPQWASRMMGSSVSQLLHNFDLRMSAAGNDNKIETNEAAAERIDKLLHPSKLTRELTPTLAHPLTTGVHQVQATWLSSEGLRWHLEGNRQSHSSLVLLRDQANHNPAMWLSFYGKGNVLITRHSDLFGNVSLREILGLFNG